MTDRLSTLMHDEVDLLTVPPAPADRIVADGRGLRRRRTTGVAAGVVAAVLAVVGIAVINQHWSDDDAITPAEQKAYVEKGAWATGNELHIGDHVVPLPDGIDLIRYTSVGVLVWRQGTGPDYSHAHSASTLVTPDGKTHPVDMPGIERVLFGAPATDPDSPLIAYQRATGEPRQGEIVVGDLRTAETRVLGTYERDHPESARVTIISAGVMVDRDIVLDPDTGDRVGVAGVQDPGMSTLSGYAADHYITTDFRTRRWQVRSVNDGRVLIDVHYQGPDSESQTPSLSPDGRYFAVPTGESGIDLYTVATGTSVHLGGDRDVSDYGWTPDGQLVGKPLASASEVETCDPTTGTCTDLGPVVSGDLTLVPGADGLPV